MKRTVSQFLTLLLITTLLMVSVITGIAQGDEVVLNVARTWEKDNMDPAAWSTHTDLVFGTSVFETLLVYNDSLMPSANLALGWEVSDDNLTYHFFLRKGVQFHHGYGEMTADDVVYTIERMKDPDLAATQNATALGIDNLAEIVAEDDYTVRFTLVKEDPIFLYKFAEPYAYVISKKAVEEMGDAGFAMKPIGTGPFAFDKGTPGVRTEIVKHEDYWGIIPQIDRITFTIITEPATLFNAFEVGEIDFMGVTEGSKLVQYKNDPKYTVHTIPSRYDGNFGMNNAISPFDNILVRKAVSHAIDRQEIADDFFLGLEVPPNSIMPTGAKYIVKDNFHPVFDPVKAKELLAEAGHPDGFETKIFCPNDEISIGPSTLIQSYLSQVGINATLNAVDFGVFLDTVRGGNAPLWYLCDGPEIIPDAWLERFTSAKAPGNNWVMFRDALYDEYVEKGLNATTEEEKAEAFALAQARFLEQFPLFPIHTSGAHYVMNNKVKGFKVRPNLLFSYEPLYIR